MKRRQLTLYPMDSGLFVARCIPKNKHVNHSVNVLLSEQQLDYVHVSKMKEFAAWYLPAWYFTISSISLISDYKPKTAMSTAFFDVFTYVFDCLYGVKVFKV